MTDIEQLLQQIRNFRDARDWQQFHNSKDLAVYEYDLESQFRNGGSEKYSEWIDHTLHIRQTSTTEWRQEDAFEFRIMDSPHALEQAVRDKVAEGYIGRVMAGFCWPWTKQADADGGVASI